MMKILVAGGAGYIGSVLIRQLLEKGYTVTVFDNLSLGGDAIIDLLLHKKFQLVHGDIRNRKQIRTALKNIDCVVNLAALVGEPSCNKDPKKTNDINYKGAKNLCDLSKRLGITRFIQISTCSNYGISDTRHPAIEDSPLYSNSIYSTTKIAAEKYVLKQTTPDFCVTVLRLATAYGVSPRMRFDTLVNEFVRDAFVNKKIVIYQPHTWRSFVHVWDIAKAIILCLHASTDKVNGHVFNIVNKNYQKQELVDFVKQYIPDCKTERIETNTQIRDYNVSSIKAKKTLGFKATISLKQGMKEVLRALEVGIFKNPNDLRYINTN